MTNRIAVLMRLGAMGSRFLALFVLAAFLNAVDVGTYGLVLATIAYASYALGLDFYAFSTRELIRVDRHQRRSILKAHAFVLGIAYALVIPISILLFSSGLLPWWLAPWFWLLLPLEHLGLEFDRILVAAGDPFGASVTVFIRQGIWPVIIGVLFWASPASRTLPHVFAIWAACAVSALVYASFRTYRQTVGGSPSRINWAWVAKGLSVAGLLLLGTLMLRVQLTVDRYLVDAVSDADALASYTLFVGLANGLTLGIAATVHQFQYPKLVATAHVGDRRAFIGALRTMAVQTCALCIGFVVVLLIVARPVVDAVGGKTYSSELWILPWVLAATVLFNLSMVPHFVLYAFGRDRLLTGCAGASLLIFAASFIGLSESMGLRAVLASLVLANASLVALKLGGAWKASRYPRWV